MGRRALRVLLFASAREAVGKSEVMVEYSDGESLGDLLGRLSSVHPKLKSFLRYKIAIDGEYLLENPTKVPLSKQKEIAILPPFSGG